MGNLLTYITNRPAFTQKYDQQRSVLVTGCSSGLGEGLTWALHSKRLPSGEKAFRVFATARRLESLEKFSSVGIETLQLDVTSGNSVSNAVASVLEATGGTLDVLICNAGCTFNGPLSEQHLDEVETLWDTNVTGVLRLVQAAAPAMIAARQGSIILIGSVVVDFVTPYGGAYAASKAALRAMGDALRLELAPFCIGVQWVNLAGVRSAISANGAKGRLDVFRSPDSAYLPVADHIEKRVWMSQNPTSMTAEAAAEQIVGPLMRPYLPPFLMAGGRATYLRFMGFLQQHVAPGWVAIKFSSMFGLNELTAAKSSGKGPSRPPEETAS